MRGVILSSVLCVSFLPTSVLAEPADLTNQRHSKKREYIAGELIIKFRESLHASAVDLIEKKASFSTGLVDKSSSLDELNQRYRLQSAKALFVERRGVSTQQALQRWRERVTNAQNRFAERSRRAVTTHRQAAERAIVDLTNIYVFRFAEDADIEKICDRYQRDKHVEYCQPNNLLTTQWAPNDPFYSSENSWGQGYADAWPLQVGKLNMEPAWEISKGDGVIVAVVDTGVDYNHPDIVTNIWTNPDEIPANGLDDDNNGYIDDVRGWNPIYGNPDPLDDHGHGTHVAGTIAAVGNNGLGITGVAPRSKIMAVKALNLLGSGTSTSTANAIVYAAMNGADVINNSWGCRDSCPSRPAQEEAVRFAHQLGSVVVFAAGNSNSDVTLRSPQNMTDPKPIVVGASTETDKKAYFSNYGTQLDLVAPGGGETETGLPIYAPHRNILSLRAENTGPENLAVGTYYRREAGTSMAAPHAAGVAALVLARHPEFTNDEVREALRASADDIGQLGPDIQTGEGRLNAFRAVSINDVLVADITETSDPNMDDEIEIYGNAFGTGFNSYQLFYALSNGTTTAWTPIGDPIFTPVQNSLLGVWDTSQLSSAGNYRIRVLVKSADDAQFQDVVTAQVQELGLINISGILPNDATDPRRDKSPKISEAGVVWESIRDSNSRELYFYDLLTEEVRSIRYTPPTDSWYVATNYDADISGSQITFRAKNDPPFGFDEIYVYDASANVLDRLTERDTDKRTPVIAGNNVWWAETDPSLPYNSYNLHWYELNSGSELTFPYSVVFGTDSDSNIAASGDNVVWVTDANFEALYNLTDPNTAIALHASNPAASDDLIVWTQGPEPLVSKIFIRDNASLVTRQLSDNGSDQIDPAISQDRVVWANYNDGYTDIYMCKYDRVTGLCPERRITTHASHQQAPAISGLRIVWEDNRVPGRERIYMYKIRLLDAAPEMQSVAEGESLTFTIQTRTEEGSLPLSARQSNGEALEALGATFTDNGDGTGTFHWTPTAVQAGVYPIIFSAFDGDLEDTQTTTVTVTDVPLAVSSIEDGPDPFSPNGDTIKDAVTINSTFNWPVDYWLIIIFDQPSGGNLVRAFTGGATISISQVWNGLHQTGSNLPDGTYRYYVHGGMYSTGDQTLTMGTATIDTHAPDISNVTPINGSTTGNRYVPFYAAVTDGVSLGSAKLRLDGAVVQDLELSNAAEIIAYVPTQALSIGGHSYQLTVTDDAGNATAVLQSFSILTADSSDGGVRKQRIYVQ